VADACRVAGLADEGLSLVTEALEYAAGSEDRWFSAELYRLKGEVLLLAGRPFQEIEACYQQALARARLQGARLMELRAATSLARLWWGQGRHDDADGLLAPIYSSFSEGFGLADLKEAKALLRAGR
jgi:predicted ATPase